MAWEFGVKGEDVILSERTVGSTASFGSGTRSEGSGGSPTFPRCSPPVTPIAVPLRALPLPSLEDQEDPTLTAVPVPRLCPQVAAPARPVPEGALDDILKDPFPETLISEPRDLQHALRAMCIQQQHLEKRVMDSIKGVMDHLQKRLPEDVAKRVAKHDKLGKLVAGTAPLSTPHAPARASMRRSARASRASQSAWKAQSEAEAQERDAGARKPLFSSIDEDLAAGTNGDKAADASGTTTASMATGSKFTGSVAFAEASGSPGQENPRESQTGRRSKNDIAGEMQDLAKAMQAVQTSNQKRAEKARKTSKKRSMKFRGNWDDDDTLFEYIMLHPGFDALCAIMILSNSILIGIVVDYETKNPKEETWMMITGHACNIFFLFELLARMWLYKWDYYYTEDRYWNMFDTGLVAFSIIDVIMTASGGGATSVGSGMKTIKMLRIVRIFRVFRFFRELSLLALMIADSIKSLMWALLMLTIIIYVFAIVFTSTCNDYVKKRRDAEDFDPAEISMVNRQFGSLSKTIYYLVLSMLGGISWGEVGNTLLDVDWTSSFFFFFYIAFTILAVMNIITGVFVDNAVETAKSQRDFLVQREIELREKYVQEMRDLFHAMDDDGSGTVTWDEMDDHFTDPRVRGYFTTLGLEVDDMKRLFALVDDDCSGEVEVDEFLDGCMRLKGDAKSIDVHAIMHQCNKIGTKVEHIVEFLKSLNGDEELPNSQSGGSYRELQIMNGARGTNQDSQSGVSHEKGSNNMFREGESYRV